MNNKPKTQVISMKRKKQVTSTCRKSRAHKMLRSLLIIAFESYVVKCGAHSVNTLCATTKVHPSFQSNTTKQWRTYPSLLALELLARAHVSAIVQPKLQGSDRTALGVISRLDASNVHVLEEIVQESSAERMRDVTMIIVAKEACGHVACGGVREERDCNWRRVIVDFWNSFFIFWEAFREASIHKINSNFAGTATSTFSACVYQQTLIIFDFQKHIISSKNAKSQNY